jgi:coenzyme F420-0:L-glutamate ligase/coenzyme F420-1:gamma-L-glutamate ligase
MVALTAQRVGSCWVSSSIFAPHEAAATLGLGPEWIAVGCVAAGYPATQPPPRSPVDPGPFLDVR